MSLHLSGSHAREAQQQGPPHITKASVGPASADHLAVVKSCRLPSTPHFLTCPGLFSQQMNERCYNFMESERLVPDNRVLSTVSIIFTFCRTEVNCMNPRLLHWVKPKSTKTPYLPEMWRRLCLHVPLDLTAQPTKSAWHGGITQTCQTASPSASLHRR